MTILWIGAVTVGLSSLWSFASTPGVAADVQDLWPENCPLNRSTSRPTLILFAHPKCPCTRASIGELAELATRFGQRTDFCVLFYVPDEGSDDWTETDLWHSAVGIPGVRVLADPAGSLSEQFGVHTSGHVLLYDKRGDVVFSGGITESRGHAGDSAGRTSIESYLLDRRVETRETAVYGCPLSAGAIGTESE